MLMADTVTTTVEERESVAMSKARIIFISFDLVWCFRVDGQGENKRRGVGNFLAIFWWVGSWYSAELNIYHPAGRADLPVTK
jgi:hypothetical protein